VDDKIFIFVTIIYFILSFGIWIWLLLGALSSGARKTIGLFAIHLSLVGFVYFAFRVEPLEALLNVLLLPASFWFAVNEWIEFRQFLLMLVPFAAMVFLVLLSILFILLPAKHLVASAAIVISLAVTISMAEDTSKILMCQAAADRELSEISRRSFYWSLRNAPQEYQFGLHAYVTHDGQRLGWSYRELNWYEISDEVHFEVDGYATLLC
jgi:cbb3-type cytochrome oxidase subunit 3